MKSNHLSLKSKVGIGFVILGFISPIFSFLVPLLNLSSEMSTTLVAFFLVGGPEVFILIGGALAGKEGVTLVKNKIKKLLGLPQGRYPAPKSQYRLALIGMMLWFILAIIPGYVPSLFDIPFIKENLLWFSVGADAIFIISIFFLGGNQMIQKIGKVFTWEPWDLPPEKEKQQTK